MNNVEVWKQGEFLAQKYLMNSGYKILHTNYRTKIGEIDIIAKDKKTIVFVEVKAKSNQNFGLPREMITPHKQMKIMQVAQQYQKHFDLFDVNCRFDVIEVLAGEINHIKNAW